MKLSIVALILLVTVIACARADINNGHLKDNINQICQISQADNDEITAIYVFPNDTKCREYILCVNVPGLYWIGVNSYCPDGKYVDENGPEVCSTVKPARCE